MIIHERIELSLLKFQKKYRQSLDLRKRIGSVNLENDKLKIVKSKPFLIQRKDALSEINVPYLVKHKDRNIYPNKIPFRSL